MSSVIGSLPGAFSAQGNPAPAADWGTIHHLPTGCKTLLGAGPASPDDLAGRPSLVRNFFAPDSRTLYPSGVFLVFS
jgi:hypothetical protein